MFLYLLVTILCALVAYAFHCAHRTNRFWPRQLNGSIPSVRGWPFIGNMAPILFQRRCVQEHYDDIYRFGSACGGAPIVGVHLFMKPALLLRDPDLIRSVLVKDFASFSNRFCTSDVHTDLLSAASLFFVKNPAWRTIRVRMTPFFTSGKMRQMYGLMEAVGRDLNRVLVDNTVGRPVDHDVENEALEIEAKNLFSRYATDVIASCAFGVQAESLEKAEGSAFWRHGRAIVDFTVMRAIEFMSVFFLPSAVSIFRFKPFSRKSSEFLRDSIGHVMEKRARSKTVRNDLIDTLLVLREEDKDKEFSVDNLVFQGDVLVAQAAAFFIAGYETTSTVLSFALFELCHRPDVQRKMRTEIAQALDRNAGRDPTHDEMVQLPYMDMVISEVLRLYPPLPFLDRECTVPAGEHFDASPSSCIDYRIPAGMPVIIPVYSLHRDAQYFPQPERFDPERFAPENLKNIRPYTYLPFGLGPHNCIGIRFGQMQMRIALFQFLRSCRVQPATLGRTPERLAFDPKALLIAALGGVYVGVVHDPI